MNIIYFDHASAAAVDEKALQALLAAYRERGFVNQEAAHESARENRKNLAWAGEIIRQAWHLPENVKFFWTANGTEALQAAGHIFGSAGTFTTEMEHPALLAAAGAAGGKVYFSPLNEFGELQINPDDAISAGHIRQSSSAWFAAINSETGLIRDFSVTAAAIRKINPHCIVGADFVQGAGKTVLPGGWDHLVISGHKFGAPGGAAVLYFDTPDGAVEKRFDEYRHVQYLAGRAEVPQMTVMAQVLSKREIAMEKNTRQVGAINHFLRQELANAVEFTLPPEKASKYILHFSVPGHDGGVLLRLLSAENVMVSAGSACQAETPTPSRALTALKWSRKKAFSALRLSFSERNTMDEAEKFVEIFRRVMKNY